MRFNRTELPPEQWSDSGIDQAEFFVSPNPGEDLRPLARIVATGVSALSPEIMGLGPVEASRRALANAGLSIRDIDLVEQTIDEMNLFRVSFR